MENKIFLPPRSWLDTISNINSEVNYRGYTRSVLFIEGYYYYITFYTKEGLKWEIENTGIFCEAGVIAIDSISIENIMDALSKIINSSYFFKHLYPYKQLHTDMDTLIHECISIPIQLELNEFHNLRK